MTAYEFLSATSGSVADRTFGIIFSQYNDEITRKLVEGAFSTLQEAGVTESNITVVAVPGAWELALAARRFWQVRQPDGIICLGCVIRGETTHDQHINNMVSRELGRLACEIGRPVGFGLLTCNTWDQAVQRSGGKVGNKGVETAKAVIEMLKLDDILVQSSQQQPTIGPVDPVDLSDVLLQ